MPTLPPVRCHRSARRRLHWVLGATVVACGTSWGHAAVVTRQVNAMLTAVPDGPNNIYALDVDGDGATDFTFTTIIGDPTDPTFASFAQVTTPFAATNGEVVDAATADGFPTISLLHPGNTVGPASTFSFVNDTGNLYEVDAFDPATGNFKNASGYVGLRFTSGAATLYGYAYVTVNDLFAATNPLAVTIGQVGYETVPGQAITLPPAAVPEPAAATLAAAAAGATLASGRRRARLRGHG